MRPLTRWLAFPLLVLFARCDCGTYATQPPLLAVGSTTTVSFIDSCSDKFKLDRDVYWQCTDESVTAFNKVSMDGPFEILSQQVPSVQLRATGPGKGTLHVDATLRTGDKKSFAVEVDAEAITRVTVSNVCLPGATNGYETTAFFDLTSVPSGASGRPLSITGLPPLLYYQGDVEFESDGGVLGSPYWAAGNVAGGIHVSSQFDSSVQPNFAVVATSDIAIDADTNSVGLKKGYVQFRPVPLYAGKPMCAVAPIRSWSVHSDRPDVCLFVDNPDGGTYLPEDAGVTDATLSEGTSFATPTFLLHEEDAGSCALTVTSAGISAPVQFQVPLK